jgi:hypothetical protein
MRFFHELSRCYLGVLLACALFSSVSISVHAEAAHFWLDTDKDILYAGRISSGQELVGRSFLVYPLFLGLPTRYDSRMILTFKPGHMLEERAMASTTYPIKYNKYDFEFTGRLESLSKLTGQAVFCIGKSGTGQLDLTKINSGNAGPTIYYRLGYARELNTDERDRFRAYLLEVRSSEKQLRDNEAGKGDTPLEYIDTVGYRGGNVIEDIYYGNFKHTDNIGSYLRAFHQTYSERYMESDPPVNNPEWIQVYDVRVRTDQFNNEKSRTEGKRYWIPTRYRSSYERAQAAIQANALNMLVKIRQDPASALSMFTAPNNGVSGFFDTYAKSSPATVTRLAENLHRAMLGLSPVQISRPQVADRFKSFEEMNRLPWEAKEESSQSVNTTHGVSWDKPERAIARLTGDPIGPQVLLANYRIGGPDDTPYLLYMHVLYRPHPDVLTWVNFCREINHDPPVESIDHERLETFAVDGLQAHILYLNGPRIYVRIHDNGRDWLISTLGHYDMDAKQQQAMIHKFLSTIEWHELTTEQREQLSNDALREDNALREQNSTRRGGRSRSRSRSRSRRR